MRAITLNFFKLNLLFQCLHYGSLSLEIIGVCFKTNRHSTNELRSIEQGPVCFNRVEKIDHH